jgi:hypothetical protein
LIDSLKYGLRYLLGKQTFWSFSVPVFFLTAFCCFVYLFLDLAISKQYAINSQRIEQRGYNANRLRLGDFAPLMKSRMDENLKEKIAKLCPNAELFPICHGELLIYDPDETETRDSFRYRTVDFRSPMFEKLRLQLENKTKKGAFPEDYGLILSKELESYIRYDNEVPFVAIIKGNPSSEFRLPVLGILNDGLIDDEKIFKILMPHQLDLQFSQALVLRICLQNIDEFSMAQKWLDDLAAEIQTSWSENIVGINEDGDFSVLGPREFYNWNNFSPQSAQENHQRRLGIEVSIIPRAYRPKPDNSALPIYPEAWQTDFLDLAVVTDWLMESVRQVNSNLGVSHSIEMFVHNESMNFDLLEIYFQDEMDIIQASDELRNASDESVRFFGRLHDIGPIQTMKELTLSVNSQRDMLQTCTRWLMILVAVALIFIQFQRSAQIKPDIGFLKTFGFPNFLIYSLILFQNLTIVFFASLIGSALALFIGSYSFFKSLGSFEGFAPNQDTGYIIGFFVITTLVSTVLSVLFWEFKLKLSANPFQLLERRTIRELNDGDFV